MNWQCLPYLKGIRYRHILDLLVAGDRNKLPDSQQEQVVEVPIASLVKHQARKPTIKITSHVCIEKLTEF